MARAKQAQNELTYNVVPGADPDMFTINGRLFIAADASDLEPIDGEFYLCINSDSSVAYEDDVVLVTQCGEAVYIVSSRNAVGDSLDTSYITEDGRRIWRQITQEEAGKRMAGIRE